jgi:hypothetical protein
MTMTEEPRELTYTELAEELLDGAIESVGSQEFQRLDPYSPEMSAYIAVEQVRATAGVGKALLALVEEVRRLKADDA